jgi:hypothetical protein
MHGPSYTDLSKTVNDSHGGMSMSLLDPKWKYTHSTATDIRKTFAKARKALAKTQPVDARSPKLHLMCGPSETAGVAGVGSRSKTSLYGTRNIGADGCMDHSHEDHAARRAAHADRRIA